VKAERVATYRNGFLERYLWKAPFGLSLMRAWQCRVLSQCRFQRPVLDLGCGEGLFSSVLFREAVDVGVDICCRDMPAAAKTEMYRQLIVADGSRLPYGDECFRTVFSNCVLEHVSDLDGLLGEVARVLERGGEFIFTVPNRNFGDYLFFSALFAKGGCASLARMYAKTYNSVFRHRHIYDMDVWERKLNKVGLKVVGYRNYFPAGAIRIYDLLLPFSLVAWFNKKVAGRWVLERNRRWPFVYLGKKILKRWYERDSNDGGELLIRSVKGVNSPFHNV